MFRKQDGPRYNGHSKLWPSKYVALTAETGDRHPDIQFDSKRSWFESITSAPKDIMLMILLLKHKNRILGLSSSVANEIFSVECREYQRQLDLPMCIRRLWIKFLTAAPKYSVHVCGMYGPFNS